MTKGFTFGNVKLYKLRKYYRGWIKATLQNARTLVMPSCDIYRLLQMEENLKPPKIVDPGRLPCSELQRHGNISRRESKIACLLVMARHLVLTWWECSADCPNLVEDLLEELDTVIEEWNSVSLIGHDHNGYHLEV